MCPGRDSRHNTSRAPVQNLLARHRRDQGGEHVGRHRGRGCGDGDRLAQLPQRGGEAGDRVGSGGGVRREPDVLGPHGRRHARVGQRRADHRRRVVGQGEREDARAAVRCGDDLATGRADHLGQFVGSFNNPPVDGLDAGHLDQLQRRRVGVGIRVGVERPVGRLVGCEFRDVIPTAGRGQFVEL